jgi:hypothetical protein
VEDGGGVTVLVDPRHTAGHGHLWCHLDSDGSCAQLHALGRREVAVAEGGSVSVVRVGV